MTSMNVSASTIGPPDTFAPGIIAQNGVVYGGVGGDAGAGGSLINSTIIGDGFGSSVNDSTAVLLFGASGVTVLGDTITGTGTDIGVEVASNSTGVVLTVNQIGRTAPDVPDSSGFGVSVEAGSTATLTCNTFSGWKTDIDGTTQGPCSLTGPAVSSWAPGRLDTFVRGSDDAIWHEWYTGAWSGWESLGKTIVSNPAAVSWGPNRIDLFGTGTDGLIYHKIWNGSTWTGWVSERGAPPPGPAPG
jgi:hypothetical protein